ncbi:unnamed protein product [Ilex paraguariensis]|uniref:Uncharacterized protein n=1 Tax=Ilex paraguariensis TaxID=185542 RepID=A0ABC8TZJ5_9AQUA
MDESRATARAGEAIGQIQSLDDAKSRSRGRNLLGGDRSRLGITRNVSDGQRALNSSNDTPVDDERSPSDRKNPSNERIDVTQTRRVARDDTKGVAHWATFGFSQTVRTWRLLAMPVGRPKHWVMLLGGANILGDAGITVGVTEKGNLGKAEANRGLGFPSSASVGFWGSAPGSIGNATSSGEAIGQIQSLDDAKSRSRGRNLLGGDRSRLGITRNVSDGQRALNSSNDTPVDDERSPSDSDPSSNLYLIFIYVFFLSGADPDFGRHLP